MSEPSPNVLCTSSVILNILKPKWHYSGSVKKQTTGKPHVFKSFLLETEMLHDIVWGIMAVANIQDDISAFEAKKQELEARSMGKWVLIHNRELVDVYDSFEMAAQDAVRQFGRGPYLIRQVGAPPITLPASVMYAPDYGQGRMRL